MQVIFVIVTIIGSIYFLFSKRQFDMFSIAFFSGCVYFLPGYFGYVFDPSTGSFLGIPIELETYCVMTAIVGAILLMAVLFDLLFKNYQPRTIIRGNMWSVQLAVLTAIIGFIMTVATTGDALLAPDKNIMMAQLNRWHTLWVTAASLGAVLSFRRSRWGLFAICMFLLFFDMYIGFRVSFAITLISIFTLWAGDKGRQRFAVRSWKIGAIGLASALFLFAYKHLCIAVKLGDWHLIMKQLLCLDFYITAITHSEPFVTQTILNQVLSKRFVAGMEHFTGLVYQFILFSSELGAKATSFNDLFQPVLFPDAVGWGMANNIWAEMWSSGGWPLLILFLIVFVLVLAIGSYLIRSADPEIAAGSAVLFSYWAFYIHRNDLLYQINLEKDVMLVWIICTLGSQLLSTMSKRTVRDPHLSKQPIQ
ncbi:MAG: hypothetical protein GXX09_09070 [Syntrophomonadaceae bacterium]|nr:hypothetical protein [Syntrophomonadaceae bacterium]